MAWCYLSEGALEIIMNGGEYNEPIMQVLGIKRVSVTHETPEIIRYRLLLSDGKTSYSFVLFTTTTSTTSQLNEDNLPLSIIAILGFTRMVITCNGGERVLHIFDMKIVVPGVKVGKKIGNPQPLENISYYEPTKNVQTCERVSANEYAIRSYKLSEGTLQIIMGGGEYNQPIMQVLGSKKVAATSCSKQRYRVLLSDGKHSISFAMWTNHTNDGIGPDGVPKYSVIKIHRFITTVVNNTGQGKQRVLLILDMQIVVPGSEVGRRIGNPKTLQGVLVDKPTKSVQTRNGLNTDCGNSASVTNLVTLNSSINDTNHIQPAQQFSGLSAYHNKSVVEATNKSAAPGLFAGSGYYLSEGALQIIMGGGDYHQPIMQVLGSKKVAATSCDKQRYRVLLSDGKHSISFAIWTNHTNDGIGPDGVPKYSIIKIHRFITSVVDNADRGKQRVLLILDMQIVIPGSEIRQTIGNPKILENVLVDNSADKAQTGSNGFKENCEDSASVTKLGTANISINDMNRSNQRRTQLFSGLGVLWTLNESPAHTLFPVSGYYLSEGALQIMMKAGNYRQPIMQVLDSKWETYSFSAKRMYRLLLSDGKDITSFALLTTRANEAIGPDGVPVFSVVRIDSFMATVVNHTPRKEQLLLVIEDMKIVVPGSQVGKKIGDPKSLEAALVAEATEN